MLCHHPTSKGYCNSETRTCDYPSSGTVAWGIPFPHYGQCDSGKDKYCSSRNGTCSRIGNRCVQQSSIPCNSGCASKNAFCDYFTRRCASVPAPTAGIAKCSGTGLRGNCGEGQCDSDHHLSVLAAIIISRMLSRMLTRCPPPPPPPNASYLMHRVLTRADTRAFNYYW